MGINSNDYSKRQPNDFLTMLQQGTKEGAEGAREQMKIEAEKAMQKTGAENSLHQLLTGKEADQKNELAKIAAQHQADDAGLDSRTKKAQELYDNNNQPGAGRKNSVVMGKENVGITTSEANPYAAQRQLENKQEAYSKRLQQQNGFHSALGDVENLTNRDGNGGVLTNPDAKLVSTGSVMSKVPSPLIGLGELLHAPGVEKGSSDERKALERLQIEYQQSKSGMRVSDQARAQERQAMGYMASGDPDLVSKGVRALARLHKSNLQTIQAGYSPEVQSAVHQQMGNPLDAYQGLYDDNAPKQAAGGPKQPPQQQAPQLSPSPSPQQGAAGGAPRPIKTLRNKRTGETKKVYADDGTDVPSGQ